MNYKDKQNNLHILDSTAFEYLLPTGSIQITDEEAVAIQLANEPVIDPKVAISAEIAQLERDSMLPRVTREFMLLFMQSQANPEQLATMPAYVRVKALDTQIATLRDQLK